MTSEMVERAARAIAAVTIPAFADERIWAEDLPHYRKRDERANREPKMENVIGIARAALLAALDPEDEALVSAIAQRLADDATVARNESRMIRQGMDLSSAEPVSPSIFKKDARAAIAALKAAAQGVSDGRE